MINKPENPNAAMFSGTTESMDAPSAASARDTDVPDSPDTDAYVPSAQAAERIGVDSRTIRRWFSSGKLKGRLEGHRLLILAEEVTRFSATDKSTIHNFAPDNETSDPDNEPVVRDDDRDMSGVEIVDVQVSRTDRDPLIEKLTGQLIAAAGRVSWLECELQERRKDLLLLPDLSAKASELESVKTENEKLKENLEKIELELMSERNKWWAKFGRWLLGRPSQENDSNG